MRLYIAEKPSMARELAACLKNPKKGNGFIETVFPIDEEALR